MDTEKIAIISINNNSFSIALRISKSLKNCDLYVKNGITANKDVYIFDDLRAVFEDVFKRYKKIIGVMALGIATRMISGLPEDKRKDPAIVVVDSAGRFAISLLSGHEGGANELALDVCSSIGAQPVITTATESSKRYVIGVGSRKELKSENIEAAIQEACRMCNITPSHIRLAATCWHKKDDKALKEALDNLGLKTVFLPKFRYSSDVYCVDETAAKKHLGIKSVAEMSALIASFNPEFVLRKRDFDGVSIAIVRENLNG
ncbi:cobalamin biosynthesis protein [Hippea alviniae]|uniref:cobalamin biosynthesis protein n=1 Tax=Hippea alviniae TaxID=1279027 RepID=UPI0003B567B1|nr:cobalamin biosynthesis protein [Hippea alviniae]